MDVMRLRTRLGTSALSYEKLGLSLALGPCSQDFSEKQKSIVGKGWVGLELLLASAEAVLTWSLCSGSQWNPQ